MPRPLLTAHPLFFIILTRAVLWTSTLQEPLKTTFIFPFKKWSLVCWKALTIAVSAESWLHHGTFTFLSEVVRDKTTLSELCSFVWVCTGWNPCYVFICGGVDTGQWGSCSFIEWIDFYNVFLNYANGWVCDRKHEAQRTLCIYYIIIQLS